MIYGQNSGNIARQEKRSPSSLSPRLAGAQTLPKIRVSAHSPPCKRQISERDKFASAVASELESQIRSNPASSGVDEDRGDNRPHSNEFKAEETAVEASVSGLYATIEALFAKNNAALQTAVLNLQNSRVLLNQLQLLQRELIRITQKSPVTVHAMFQQARQGIADTRSCQMGQCQPNYNEGPEMSFESSESHSRGSSQRKQAVSVPELVRCVETTAGELGLSIGGERGKQRKGRAG